MTRLLVLAFAYFAHANSSAQDALEPCLNRLGDPYHAAVNRVIQKAVAKTARLSLTTIPSFRAESGLRLVGNEVYHVEFPASFWYESSPKEGSGRMDFKRPRIVGKVRRAIVSVEVADRIEQVFVKAVAQSKSSGWEGLDGVDYFVVTPEGRCGHAWSPRSGTRNERLVQLIEHLEKHTTFITPIDLRRSEESLSHLLKRLEAD